MYSDQADKKERRKYCTGLCLTLFNLQPVEQFLAHADIFDIQERKLINSMKMHGHNVL